MFHDIQRGGFAKQPAGKNPLPLIFTRTIGRPFVDQQLDKGALFRGQFPRGGSLARPQANDRSSDPHRLAGPKLEIPGQTVALVEKTERGDAFRHRCADLIGDRRDQVTIGGGQLSFFCGLTGRMFVDIVAAQPAAAGQHKRRRQHRA